MLDFKYKLMKKNNFCCTSAAIAPKNIACYEINADFCVWYFLIKVNARGFSQDIRVSLDCQNERLGDVFKELEKQTNYFFLFQC